MALSYKSKAILLVIKRLLTFKISSTHIQEKFSAATTVVTCCGITRNASAFVELRNVSSCFFVVIGNVLLGIICVRCVIRRVISSETGMKVG